MDLIQLTEDYELKPFDCGDADLNGFFVGLPPFRDRQRIDDHVEIHTGGRNHLFHIPFLTVDAYLSAIPFYDKNDFTLLQPDDEDKHTRLMYFDMTRL